MQGFFDQLMSYQLLLDLLYENARYDDVIETFELIKSKQIQGTKYPKNIVVLTMAACYKQVGTLNILVSELYLIIILLLLFHKRRIPNNLI